ncbi:putative carboxylesterase 17 [Silene latifolia]|uniref:putative carboxylesterase 17 n=1 Tax=Silene latifolia TaxID=37657 RepID=UPI003D77CCA6
MSLIAEAPDFLQVFSDGSVKRFAPDIVLASPKSSKHYKWKDVIIDGLKQITGRIFFPNTQTITPNKLPILIYFHGGGFCIGSTTWLNYHVFLGDLASLANVIIISVNYRLAPENRLPVAYLDCYTSLEWLIENQGSDHWLDKADLSRVFFSGDSAGGNIAHNLAIKTIKDNLSGIQIKGLLLIHPFFGSEKRTPKEMSNENANEVKMNDMFWGLSIPEGSTRDYYGCNFEANEVDEDEWSRFPGVMVFVAGLDFLMERGVMYVEYLRKKDVKVVKLIEAKNEGHVYHVYYPESEATGLLRRQMSDFINSF